MSKKHPIIAITGASGAGVRTLKHEFDIMFYRNMMKPVTIEGSGFRRYDTHSAKQEIESRANSPSPLSEYSPDFILLDGLENTFKEYSESGGGISRMLPMTDDDWYIPEGEIGKFTPWEDIEPNTDILVYFGNHGGLVTDKVNIAQYVDLLVGVVPLPHLEWIQRIHRDNVKYGYSAEHIVDTIINNLHDYYIYIVPQFSRADINLQRIPLVDVSNPFIARDIPAPHESHFIITIKDPIKFNIDFHSIMWSIPNAYMPRDNTIGVPGTHVSMVLDAIFIPIFEWFMARRHHE